ncbi:MAG: 5,6-dimethylbenzimidazole synthase [Arcobacter sp.]|nr:MAG: 5,6-dimethylbenzimidazole synthase [Arcobacter sp.]
MNFSDLDTQTLLNIMKARRDVRGHSFLSQAIQDSHLDLILEAALCAPSVGYSQPWEFILIDKLHIKEDIYQNFLGENQKASTIFKDRPQYQELKLEGIIEAPLNICVLYTPQEDEAVLGQTSMDKMGEYSVVCAIENMWLMSRSLGIGMGWVSILDEDKLLDTLNIPKDKKLIAYLCLGYVKDFKNEPELKTLKWKKEKVLQNLLHKNFYETK